MKKINGVIFITLFFISLFSYAGPHSSTELPIDNLLKESLLQKKVVTKEVTHLIEEADYKEKTKKVVQVIERQNSKKKTQ